MSSSSERLAKLVERLGETEDRRRNLIQEIHQLASEMLPPSAVPTVTRAKKRKGASYGKHCGRLSAVREVLADSQPRTRDEVHRIITEKGIPGDPNLTRSSLNKLVLQGKVAMIGDGSDRIYQLSHAQTETQTQ